MVKIAAALCLVAAVACVLSSSALAGRVVKDKFIVEGRVFCDTCQAGYETPASTYIAGAKVRVECRSKETGAKTCSFDGVTDSTGTYNVLVQDEHEHEQCHAVLVSSPDSKCATMVDGREKAPVFLTRNNGLASEKRLANAMGFKKDTPLPVCKELMLQYALSENDD